MFRSSEDYEYFADYIRRESRYVLDARQQAFLDPVVETSTKRTTTIESGQVLWRAAQGCVAEEGVHPHDVFFLESIEPHTIERMKPLRDRAYEGRVNPKGVPCLYMATDAVTAMMETRPWAGSVLTVSQLVLLKQVTVVDCTLPATFDLDSHTQEQLESNSWYVLNEAFSMPVFQAEDVADYAPTQYIAEAFRAAGYGGIMYTSQVGDGKNVALFDVHAAEVASRQLRRAKKLSFTFAKVGAVFYEGQYREQLLAQDSAQGQ
ncbi:RES family NAD+ phosphorylase [Tunturiibacter gelidiferens]|uniref:RES family NAD+ phosphorylase n=1 Tax=Tunturiibacter gelidiferens TaxID=3069689 RepID=UPI003D9AD108